MQCLSYSHHRERLLVRAHHLKDARLFLKPFVRLFHLCACKLEFLQHELLLAQVAHTSCGSSQSVSQIRGTLKGAFGVTTPSRPFQAPQPAMTDAEGFSGLAYVSGICFLLLASLTWLRQQSHRLPYPPGPSGLPVLGNTLQMPHERQWLQYVEWGRKYGAPFRVS